MADQSEANQDFLDLENLDLAPFFTESSQEEKEEFEEKMWAAFEESFAMQMSADTQDDLCQEAVTGEDKFLSSSSDYVEPALSLTSAAQPSYLWSQSELELAQPILLDAQWQDLEADIQAVPSSDLSDSDSDDYESDYDFLPQQFNEDVIVANPDAIQQLEEIRQNFLALAYGDITRVVLDHTYCDKPGQLVERDLLSEAVLEAAIQPDQSVASSIISAASASQSEEESAPSLVRVQTVKVTKKRGRGRPRKYTPEQAKEIKRRCTRECMRKRRAQDKQSEPLFVTLQVVNLDLAQYDQDGGEDEQEDSMETD